MQHIAVILALSDPFILTRVANPRRETLRHQPCLLRRPQARRPSTFSIRRA